MGKYYKLYITRNDGFNGRVELEEGSILKNLNINRLGYTFGRFYLDQDLTKEIKEMPSKDTKVFVWWKEEAKPSNFFYTIKGNKVTITKYIGSDVFLVIPEYIKNKRVTKITGEAFINSKVVSVTIPKYVELIQNSTFKSSNYLTEVINKSKLKFTRRSNTYGIFTHAWIIKDKGLTELNQVGDYIFSSFGEDYNYLMRYIGENSNIILPNNYNGKNYTIHMNAFNQCKNLRNVVVPDDVRGNIREDAFYKCPNLVSVTIGRNVGYIAISTFTDCHKLSKIINRSKSNISFNKYKGFGYLDINYDKVTVEIE